MTFIVISDRMTVPDFVSVGFRSKRQRVPKGSFSMFLPTTIGEFHLTCGPRTERNVTLMYLLPLNVTHYEGNFGDFPPACEGAFVYEKKGMRSGNSTFVLMAKNAAVRLTKRDAVNKNTIYFTGNGRMYLNYGIKGRRRRLQHRTKYVYYFNSLIISYILFRF